MESAAEPMEFERLPHGAEESKKVCYYICKARQADDKCIGHQITEKLLKALIMDQLHLFITQLSDRRKVVEELRKIEDVQNPVYRAKGEIMSLTDKISQMAKKREQLYADYVAGVVDSEDYQLIREDYSRQYDGLRAALKEAEKILGDTDEACTFFLGSKHILFNIGEATLVCRLLEGEFLDWRRVLPQNQPVKLAVNVAKMTDSIERVGLIISEKLKSPVRCKFGENTADFRSVSTIGEAHDVCQIAGDGQDMEIGFNCRYLLDALRAIPDAECSLELINGLSPIVMNPCDGSERYSYMVLPVRLKAGE